MNEGVIVFGLSCIGVAALVISMGACEVKTTRAKTTATTESCKAVMEHGTDAAKLQATQRGGVCFGYASY